MDQSCHNELNNCQLKYQTLDEESPTCRICFEEESPDNKLISPCKCTGNSKFIHERCLHTWRFSNEIGSEARNSCMECKHQYQVRRVVTPIPKSFKLCRHFHKHFMCHSIIIIVLANVISDTLCSSDKVNSDFGSFMSYKLEGDYNNCIVIPNVFIILMTGYLYLSINQVLIKDSILSNNLIKHKIIANCVIFLTLSYLVPSYTMLIYLISIQYIYQTYLRDNIDNYGSINELIVNYSEDSNLDQNLSSREVVESIENDTNTNTQHDDDNTQLNDENITIIVNSDDDNDDDEKQSSRQDSSDDLDIVYV